jgi:hypothetical protein
MSPSQALTTVHADYIGGQHANIANGTWPRNSTSMMQSVHPTNQFYSASNPSDVERKLLNLLARNPSKAQAIVGELR